MPAMIVDGVLIAASTEDSEENIASAAGGE
jgi:hypothetical protein